MLNITLSLFARNLPVTCSIAGGGAFMRLYILSYSFHFYSFHFYSIQQMEIKRIITKHNEINEINEIYKSIQFLIFVIFRVNRALNPRIFAVSTGLCVVCSCDFWPLVPYSSCRRRNLVLNKCRGA